jgi:hypothetical protein
VACESVNQALCDLLMELLGGLVLLDSELAAGAAEYPERVAMLSVPRHPEPRHELGLAPRPFNDRGALFLDTIEARLRELHERLRTGNSSWFFGNVR